MTTRAERVAEELTATIGRAYEAEAGPVAAGGMKAVGSLAYRQGLKDATEAVRSMANEKQWYRRETPESLILREAQRRILSLADEEGER